MDELVEWWLPDCDLNDLRIDLRTLPFSTGAGGAEAGSGGVVGGI